MDLSTRGVGENRGGDTFLSPKRKRLLSPNCAKAKAEHAMTHVPSHRDWSETPTNLGDGDFINQRGICSPVRSVGLTASPETATFLRKPKPAAQQEQYNDNLYNYTGLNKKYMFGKNESTYSTDDERDASAINSHSCDAIKYDEMKKENTIRHDGDGDGDTGAESDFSGVAGRMSTLSVGKRHSAFRGPATKRPSPLSSPSSSQNSSLNNSIMLSPSRQAFKELDSSPNLHAHYGNAQILDQDPLSSMYTGTMQPGRRPKVSKMVASAILNRSAATEAGRVGPGRSYDDSPSRALGSGTSGTPIHQQEGAGTSVNNTHLSAFCHGSGLTNHSNTELLYSYHQDQDDGNHGRALLDESSRSSQQQHNSSSSLDRHARNVPYTPFMSNEATLQTSSTKDTGLQEKIDTKSGSLNNRQHQQVSAESTNVWDVHLPHQVGSSPVLTPTRPRRTTRTEPGTHSQSLSMSQQSYHEEAMGDLGTPVEEIGSPAVIDGIDDLVGEDDDEDASPSLSDGRPLGRALFSGGGGSLFQDDERQGVTSEAKAERRGRGESSDQDDPEVAQISAMHTSISSRSLPPLASGMKHALEHRDVASSVGSSGGSGVHRAQGHVHQKIRTYSPFTYSDEHHDDSRDASFLQDEDEHEYHLFAQQFMCSPTNVHMDVGRSRSPFMNNVNVGVLQHHTHREVEPESKNHASVSKQSALDFSGDTTGVMSETRSASDFLNLSKSSSSEGGNLKCQEDSGLMDTSVGSTGSARPLPDQSAFDGPAHSDLSRSSYGNNNSSTLQEPPFFGSPSSLRKRRPHHSRIYSPASSEDSPEAAAGFAPPTPVKSSLAWGSPGPLGSPQPNKAMRHDEDDSLRSSNSNHHHHHRSAHRSHHTSGHGASALLDYTPSPAGKSLASHALGIAVPSSADTERSEESSGSDILLHSWNHGFDRSDSDVKAPPHPSSRIGSSTSYADPFSSISHSHLPRALPLVRQSSLQHNKVLLSQNEDERLVSYRDDFEEVGLLGSGTFADVYKVRQREGAVPGTYFAVKKIKQQLRSKKYREWLMAEVRTMKLLGQQSACVYVVPFFRAWQEDSYLYVQMGFAERGTLRELMFHVASLKRQGGSSHSSSVDMVESIGLMPDNTVWHVVHDVCAGLQHIHACGYVHLDIKPANLLITEGGTVQIGDFGMAVRVGSCEDGHEGDTRYMAEELLNNNQRMPSADLFSLGLTLYEMCCFFAEHDSSDKVNNNNRTNNTTSDRESSVRFNVRRGLPSNGPLWHTLREDRAPPLPTGRSPMLHQVVSACMRSEADKRPSAAEVLSVQEVQDTLDDVDAVLLCAPRHSDSPRPPFIARSASMQDIDSFPSQPQPSGASIVGVGSGTGIVGASRVPPTQGLSIAVGADNQIDYSSLGDGAFTPSFGHGHQNYSPR